MDHVAGCWQKSRIRAKAIKARGYITQEYSQAHDAIERSIEFSKKSRKEASKAADEYVDALREARSATRLLEDKLHAAEQANENIDTGISKDAGHIGR